MKALPSVTQELTLGAALRAFGQRMLAKLAGYKAATPGPNYKVGSRIGTNPNASFAQIQRIGMMFTAEEAGKSNPLCGAYLTQRGNYCSSMIRWIPNTGDAKLDALVNEYLQGEDGVGGVWSTMGQNCSMQSAFARTADIELPVRGDSGMVWYRDSSGNLKLMEFCADQLGEPYAYMGPQWMPNGLTYIAGRFFDASGECVGYRIYERTEGGYGGFKDYSAGDVLFFQDPMSFHGVRGVTKLANALIHMQKGEQLFQYGLDAAQRQAKTAFFITNGAGQGNADEQTYEALDGNQLRYVERIGDGAANEYGYTGDTMEAIKVEMPGPELIAGCEFSDQRVALALGLTFSFLVSPEKVGGAPSRLDVNKVTKEFDRIKNTIHRPQLHKIKDISILEGVRLGALPNHPNILRGSFMLPISPTVDAFYDTKETVTMLRSGLQSPQEICAETNRNWDEVRRAKVRAAVDVAIAVEDANDELEKLGYEGRITAYDVMQLSDNPYQGAVAEQI